MADACSNDLTQCFPIFPGSWPLFRGTQHPWPPAPPNGITTAPRWRFENCNAKSQ